MKRWTARLSLVGMLALTACTDGLEETPPDTPGDGTAARIELHTCVALLTEVGDQTQLVAVAYDAQGEAIETDVVWSSDDDSQVSVASDGTVTAQSAVGSANVVASADGVSSEPVFVYIARPVDGALLYTNAQLVTAPTLLDETPEAIVGSRHGLTLRDVETPAVGTIVLPSEDSAGGGRVLSAVETGAGVELELEVRPLDELWLELAVHYERQLGDGEVPAGRASFTVGPFECEFEHEVSLGNLEPQEIDVEHQLAFTVDLELDDGALQGATLALQGPIDVTAFVGYTVPDTQGASLVCEAVLFTPSVPIPSMGVLWAQFPMGVGFDLRAEVTGTEVRLGVEAEASFDVAAGFVWDPIDGFEVLQTFETTSESIEPIFEVPDADDLRFEASSHVYGFVNIDASLLQLTSWQLVASKAGPRAEIDLATRLGQAADEEYASSYQLDLAWEVGAGSGVQSFLDHIGLGDTLDLSYSDSTVLARSPSGDLSCAGETVGLYGEVDGTVTLTDPTFLGMENVESVEIYRYIDADTELEPLVSIPREAVGQTEYTFTWSPTEDHEDGVTLVAFVRTEFLPPAELEVGDDASHTLGVERGTLLMCVEDVTAPSDSSLDSVDADEQILDYINTLDALYTYLSGQVTYWMDMYSYYVSIYDYTNAANALGMAEAFGVERDLITTEELHWSEFYVTIDNVRDAPARFSGGVEDNDNNGGWLEAFAGYYEIGWEDSGWNPHWDDAPEESQQHTMIIAPSFGDDPLLLVMWQTRAVGIADPLPDGTVVKYDPAVMFQDFMFMAPYVDEPELRIQLDGQPLIAMQDMVFAGSDLVRELSLGQPHTLEVWMTAWIADANNFPAWGHTTTMELGLFRVEFTLVEGPESTEPLYFDLDEDGYGDPETQFVACVDDLNGFVFDATDCDDTDGATFPGAAEICDGLDNDCNELLDDAPIDGATFYLDGDGDGFGDAGHFVVACEAPQGYVEADTDCDDANAAIHPLADEVCNGIDDDCDGALDTDDPDVLDATWWLDADLDGYGDAASSLLACSPPGGYVENAEDCDDSDDAIHPDAAEICNEVDDDCDGLVDIDDPDVSDALTYCLDDDGDVHGTPDDAVEECAAPPGYVEDCTDCDDTDAAVYEGATEVWYDGVDSDCDGSFDPDACGSTPPAGAVSVDPLCVGAASLRPVVHVACQGACGDDVEVLFQVGNEGGAATSGAVAIAIYGEDLYGGRTLLDSTPLLGAIGAGVLTAAYSLTLSAADAAGYDAVIAVVDDQGVESECDESDNEAAVDVSAVCL